MEYLIIAVNLLLVIILYYREQGFGICSLYSISLMLFYFVPLLLDLVYLHNFDPSIEVSISFLIGTILMSRIKSQNSLFQILQLNLSKRSLKIVDIFVILSLIISLFFLNPKFQRFGYFVLTGSFAISFYFFLYYYRQRKDGFRSKAFYYLFISVSLFSIFYFLLWNVFGRLIVAKFAFIVLVLLSQLIQKSQFLLKTFIICLLPVLIVISGFMRSQNYDIKDTFTQGEGIGSLISPIIYTEKVYDDVLNKRITPIKGNTYLATLLFFVPRRIWPEKPEGFGSTLVMWYMPSTKRFGHSLAATYVGEAVGNFGRMGLLLGPFMLYVFFGLVSRGTNLDEVKTKSHLTMFIRALIAILFMTSMPDLIWAGFFTFFSRAVLSMIPVIMIYFLIRIRINFKVI